MSRRSFATNRTCTFSSGESRTGLVLRFRPSCAGDEVAWRLFVARALRSQVGVSGWQEKKIICLFSTTVETELGCSSS